MTIQLTRYKQQEPHPNIRVKINLHAKHPSPLCAVHIACATCVGACLNFSGPLLRSGHFGPSALAPAFPRAAAESVAAFPNDPSLASRFILCCCNSTYAPSVKRAAVGQYLLSDLIFRMLLPPLSYPVIPPDRLLYFLFGLTPLTANCR